MSLEVHHAEVLPDLPLAEEVLQVEVLAHLQRFAPISLLRVVGDGVSCLTQGRVLSSELCVHRVLLGCFTGAVHDRSTSRLGERQQPRVLRLHVRSCEARLRIKRLSLRVKHLEIVRPQRGLVSLVGELLRQSCIGLLADDLLGHGVGLSTVS